MRPLHIFYSSIALLCLVAFYSCGSSKSSQGSDFQNASWQAQPLTIDGDDADWVKPLTNIDKKEKLDYRVSNDSTNLYIVLSTGEEQTQRKIMQGGLTVWINNSAQKSDVGAAGISFPTGISSNKGRSILPVTGPVTGNKVIALDNLKDYTLFGFSEDGVENLAYGEPNKQGIEVKVDFNNNNELIYEASIPLKAIFPRNSGNRYAGKNVAVGFIIDGIPPQPGDRDNGGGGVSIGGGLGAGSFGSGGGVGLSIGSGSLGRIGGKGGRFKQSKIWQVVAIARPSTHN